MTRTTSRILAITVIAAAAACSDSSSTSPNPAASAFLDAAFVTTPAGFSSTDNSFSPSGDQGEPWRPDRNARGNDGMMGGGMGAEFLGGVGLGRGFDHGPFGFGYLLSNCTFSTTSGLVTCPDVSRGGLTISRSFSFKDASGTAQSMPGATTDQIGEHVSVSGNVTRHDGKVTSTITAVSDRSVAGLAPGSAQRTVNGAAKGTESSTGTTEDGTSFTASRVVADTTKALVIPLQDGHPTYPSSGTIHRVMQVTITLNGQAPVTKTRDELVTYDGSSTAHVVITKDGTTKNCTLPLPFGKLNCQ